jgi:3-methyl-2-oxobutanoate hydroxymethyltransferase
MSERVTVETLWERKRSGERIVGLSAFDYPTAVLVDRAGMDVVLVGDSLGQLALGHRRIEDTTMDEMIHHCKAVSRGVDRAVVIGDMPFGSYEVSPTLAVENAGRLVKEGGVTAVKVEGGLEVTPAVEAISAAHIPVVGHLTAAHLSGNGDTVATGVEAACALEDAGVAAIVLVGLASEVAEAITKGLKQAPSIGYRSGPKCDGQLLVTPFMVGLAAGNDFEAGPYGALGMQLLEAFRRFGEDMRRGG